MKKKFVLILTAMMLCLVFVLTACGGTDGNGSGGTDNETGGQTNSQTDGTDDETDKEAGGGHQETVNDILIAYFSATGTTRGVAEKIAQATGGELHEIVPQVPYTQADLNYGSSNSRTSTEDKDPDARPEIGGSVENMAEYDVVFLGYPIWFGSAPKIIYTFLESYDFSGKTIFPFCTSASSSMGASARNLHPLAQNATWEEGRRFPSGTTQQTVDEWVKGIELLKGDEMVQQIYLTIGEQKIAVKLEENEATNALVALLKEGEIVYTASEYGGFEKVGSLGHTLPHTDTQLTTEAGDVVLYLGNQIVLFYGSNSWSYTKLGKVQGVSADAWRSILTQADPLTVKIGL